MYTVKIISNTVSENLERLIGFYIDEVVAKHPGAIMTFQYQALSGIGEQIYTCMVTVNTSIIDAHYSLRGSGDALTDFLSNDLYGKSKKQPGKE